ncbi:MAG: DUF3313 domain-containing protein [Rhodospirillaceae bacterium]|nr:DUF3313 domain-containing protein [Rhodospirillaceae bacterium]
MSPIGTYSRSILLTCILTLTACTSNTGPSGFLTSYDGFRSGPKGGVDWFWAPPEIKSEAAFKASIRSYRAVMIDPVWISTKDKKNFDGVEQKKLNELASHFRQEIASALGSRYQIVSHPGNGVLRIAIALTGVESPNRLLAATSTFSPFGLGISTIKKLTTGEHSNVGGASMEALVTDAQSGKALFAAIDRQPGSKDLNKIADSLSGAKQAFKWWAERFRRVLTQ